MHGCQRRWRCARWWRLRFIIVSLQINLLFTTDSLVCTVPSNCTALHRPTPCRPVSRRCVLTSCGCIPAAGGQLQLSSCRWGASRRPSPALAAERGRRPEPTARRARCHRCTHHPSHHCHRHRPKNVQILDEDAPQCGVQQEEVNDLEEAFECATMFVAAGGGGGLAEHQLLQLYALYKQATVGACPAGSKKPLFDRKARAKLTVWQSHNGLSTSQAQQKYVELLDQLVPEWSGPEAGSEGGGGGGGGGGGKRSGGAGGPVQSRMADEEDDGVVGLSQWHAVALCLGAATRQLRLMLCPCPPTPAFCPAGL